MIDADQAAMEKIANLKDQVGLLRSELQDEQRANRALQRQASEDRLELRMTRWITVGIVLVAFAIVGVTAWAVYQNTILTAQYQTDVNTCIAKGGSANDCAASLKGQVLHY